VPKANPVVNSNGVGVAFGSVMPSTTDSPMWLGGWGMAEPIVDRPRLAAALADVDRELLGVAQRACRAAALLGGLVDRAVRLGDDHGTLTRLSGGRLPAVNMRELLADVILADCSALAPLLPFRTALAAERAEAAIAGYTGSPAPHDVGQGQNDDCDLAGDALIDCFSDSLEQLVGVGTGGGEEAL